MSEQPSITCPVCGMTSHNPNDVLHRYCGNCHSFIDGPFARVLCECLFCGSVEYDLGPRGGAARNITCQGCGARYNIVDHPPHPRFLIQILSKPREQS